MNELSWAILGLIVFSIFWIASGGWAKNNDAEKWNGGYCKCNGRWEHYDNDSQGGRGYNCSKCDAGIWISYAVDKI